MAAKRKSAKRRPCPKGQHRGSDGKCRKANAAEMAAARKQRTGR